MKFRNRAVAAGLCAVLAYGAIVPVAYASPQSDLAAASQHLEELGGELSKLQGDLAQKTADLEQTSYLIGEKQATIEQTEQELEEAKAILGGRMRSTYKSGRASLLQVLLGADSLDDIISRIYYMDKIASNDAATINDVRELEERLIGEKTDLEQTKQSQQKAVDDLQGQVDEYGSKVAEAQEYYNALDAQVQAEIAAQQEAEENERIRQAIEAAESEEVTPQPAQDEPEQQPEEQKPEEQESEAEPEQEPEAEPEQEPEAEPEQEPEAEPEQQEDDSSGGGQSYGPSGGGLDTAYSAIGSPYVWGAAGPSSFDCSGLVCYCYGYERGRDTYSMISSLQSTGSWKTSMSELSAGDLVFTSEGHVGIYVGGGQMIHAPSPGRSVEQADVYAFIGGGTY